jgi:hypothetical protein
MRQTSHFAKARIDVFRGNYKPKGSEEKTFLLRRNLLAKSKDGHYTVYYAPLGEWLPKRSDRLILVGITPALAHMEAADQVFRKTPAIKRKDEHAYSNVLRNEVAFIGDTGKNLCEMLDDIDLPRWLDAKRASELFELTFKGVAMTSALFFPTFKDGKGLSGYPPCTRWAMFDDLLASHLIPRLHAAPKALIIPLGAAAEKLVARAIHNSKASDDRPIDTARILSGFPHPSNQNRTRKQKLARNRDALRGYVRSFLATR